MDNKYPLKEQAGETLRGEFKKRFYIPDLEDLYVGYECEIRAPKYEGQKFIIDEDQVQYAAFCIRAGILFTPYLTMEQIEAEGWEVISRELKAPPYEVDWIVARKGDYELCINLAMHKSMLLHVDRIKFQKLFSGKCMSINEFRYIINRILCIK